MRGKAHTAYLITDGYLMALGRWGISGGVGSKMLINLCILPIGLPLLGLVFSLNLEGD